LASIPRIAEMIATIAPNTTLLTIANHTSVMFAKVPNELQKLPGATPLVATDKRNAAPVPDTMMTTQSMGATSSNAKNRGNHKTPDRVNAEHPHGVEFLAHGTRPEV